MAKDSVESALTQLSQVLGALLGTIFIVLSIPVLMVFCVAWIGLFLLFALPTAALAMLING